MFLNSLYIFLLISLSEIDEGVSGNDGKFRSRFLDINIVELINFAIRKYCTYSQEGQKMTDYQTKNMKKEEDQKVPKFLRVIKAQNTKYRQTK